MLVPFAVLAGFWAAFDFLRDAEASRFLVVAVAIAVGVGGVFFLFWAMDRVVDLLPGSPRARPSVRVRRARAGHPGLFLVYPVINTILISFQDARSESFVGFDNYRFLFTDDSMLRSIRNTSGWIVLVPLFGVTHRAGLRHARRSPPPRRGGWPSR